MALSDRIKLTRRTVMSAGAAVVAVGGTAYALRGGNGDRRHTATDPHTLSRGNGAEPDTLDPHKASGNWENNIIGDMFMGLMTENAAGNPVFGAAEDYRVSGDGLVYTFKIRDHHWSDGVPVTAHDFVFSFRRILDPRTAAQYASILYPVRNAEAVNAGRLQPGQVGVRAIDDRTLEIAFEYQVPYVPQLLTHYSTFAVPQHVVTRHGDNWLKPENIVTNGAFVLKEWVPNDHIWLAKNPAFFDQKSVKLENVYFYPTQDSAAALKRFRAGEFDIMTDSIPPQQIDWLRANMPKELRLWPFILTQYVQYNTRRKPFDDVRVREALSLAIDREILTSRVMRAGEGPAYSFVPPGMPQYPGKAALKFKSMPMKARLARARELLVQAGYTPGNPLAFDYNTSNTTEAKLVSVALQAMWKDIGVQARIVPSETQIHYNLLRKRDFSAAWAGWVADYRDAKDYLFLFQSSTRDLNYGDYTSEAYDAFVAESDQERSVSRRAGLLEQAEQRLLDDAAIVPVFFGMTRDLVSTQVRGWVSNNINVNRSRYLWLDRRSSQTA